MATTTLDDEQEEEKTQRAELVSQWVKGTVKNVTDTGPATGMSLRVWMLMIGIALSVSMSLPPLNYIGVVLVVMLALTLASRSRPWR